MNRFITLAVYIFVSVASAASAASPTAVEKVTDGAGPNWFPAFVIAAAVAVLLAAVLFAKYLARILNCKERGGEEWHAANEEDHQRQLQDCFDTCTMPCTQWDLEGVLVVVAEYAKRIGLVCQEQRQGRGCVRLCFSNQGAVLECGSLTFSERIVHESGLGEPYVMSRIRVTGDGPNPFKAENEVGLYNSNMYPTCDALMARVKCFLDELGCEAETCAAVAESSRL